jgi:hypothetical protein
MDSPPDTAAQEVLGSGANAVAYRASRPDGSEVALKTVSLRGLRDWKQLELFQRESKVGWVRRSAVEASGMS